MLTPALYRLPVPNVVGVSDDDPNSVGVAYVQELRRVTNPDELIAHVERWLPLWEMDREKQIPIPAETEIVDGSWKTRAAEIWDCVQTGRTSECPHMQAGHDCPATHILLPVPLARTYLLAHRYGIPQSVALERGYGHGHGY